MHYFDDIFTNALVCQSIQASITNYQRQAILQTGEFEFVSHSFRKPESSR